MDWIHRISAASDAGQPAHSIELAKRALAAGAESFSILMLLSAELQELQELARYGDALEMLQQAEALAGYEQLVLVYRQRGHLEQDRANVIGAQHWFERSIAARPDDATGYVYLGALLAKFGDFDAAAGILRRATACHDGALDEAWLNLGLVMRAQEAYAEALVCFHRALELDPSYQRAMAAIADVEQVMIGAGEV